MWSGAQACRGDNKCKYCLDCHVDGLQRYNISLDLSERHVGLHPRLLEWTSVSLGLNCSPYQDGRKTWSSRSCNGGMVRVRSSDSYQFREHSFGRSLDSEFAYQSMDISRLSHGNTANRLLCRFEFRSDHFVYLCQPNKKTPLSAPHRTYPNCSTHTNESDAQIFHL